MRREFYPACMSRNLVRIGQREYGDNRPSISVDLPEHCDRLRIVGLTRFPASGRRAGDAMPLIGWTDPGHAGFDPAQL